MSLSPSPDRSDVINDGYVSAIISVGTSQVEAKVGASILSNRQELMIYNDSSSVIYIGPSGVTTSGANKGIPLQKKSWINLPMGDYISVYMIAGSASNDVIVQELA